MSLICIANPLSELDTITWEAITLRDDFEAKVIQQCIRKLSVYTPLSIFITQKEIYERIVDGIT